MSDRTHLHIHFAALLLGVMSLSACAGLDRLGSRLDMAAGRLGEPGRHIFEGRVESVRHYANMSAIQFIGGKYFDVVLAPGLERGDTVRIYKAENGYQARLWAHNIEEPQVIGAPKQTSKS